MILKQMKKCVSKIYINEESKGIGFFCKIHLNNNKYINTFITNNHIINEKFLKEKKEIRVKMEYGKNMEILNIKINNKIYEVYDISIIELKENDKYEYL